MLINTTAAAPAAWVLRFLPLLPTGLVLDLACGSGRHTRCLLERGHAVLALDRDAAMLAPLELAGARTMQHDLEAGGVDWPFAAKQFAAIVVSNYLHRPLFPLLLNSLQDGGVLIYQTFAIGNAAYGKPSNPDFLLYQGELLAHLAADSSMQVIAYEHGYVSTPKPAVVQRICARKGGDGARPSALCS